MNSRRRLRSHGKFSLLAGLAFSLILTDKPTALSRARFYFFTCVFLGVYVKWSLSPSQDSYDYTISPYKETSVSKAGKMNIFFNKI